MLFGGATGAQQAPTFTLIAGGGFGDGGLATAANMHGAADIVFDFSGNAYVSQFNGNRIRKITPGGVITTVVGGTTGFSGDFGQASAAAIDQPSGLAYDTTGNLYFSDAGNHRVRRIAPNGLITTVAGNGSLVHSGDGGSALSAGIAKPSGLTVDSAGNLYIADMASHRIRKVTMGGTITTIAGTGVAGYSGDFGPATSAMLNSPQGIDIDSNGNLYIADVGNNAVRKIAANGTITTALPPPALPLNVAIDAANNVYVGDANTCSLIKLTTGAPVKIAGLDNGCADGASGGAATTTAIGSPDGIGFDGTGGIVFVDADYARLRKVSSGVISLFAGVGGNIPDGTAAVGAPLSLGMAMAVESDGDVLLSDSLVNKRVRRISTGGAIYTIAGNGSLDNIGTCVSALPCPALHLTFPQGFGLAIGQSGNVLVADRAMDRIVSIDAGGTASLFAGTTRAGGTGNGDFGPATSASMDPDGIARDNAGNTFVSDYRGHRIRRIDAGGTITTWAGTGTAGFSGDNGSSTSAQINLPGAIAADALGNVYFSDTGNRRVRKASTSGLITTIAGTGSDDVTGDGGLATQAGIGSVRGIAIDASGVVYITSNGRLRRILVDGRIESLAGWTHYAMSLAISNGQLYIASQEGLVYRMPLEVAVVRRVPNDYDGDGKSDIAWHNTSSGANTVWKAANNATQIPVTGVSNLAWQIVGQGDFDNDGKSDLAWRNYPNGANVIWRSADSTTQIAMTGVTNLAWAIEGVGDFDGDGKSDLLWRNSQNGANTIWRSANNATQTALATVPSNTWGIVGVGDFDADGKSDILWRNSATGANSIWRSGNSATQLPIVGVNNLDWKIQGVGDFDGDGKADIFWRNTGNGSNVIWRSGDVATQMPVTGVTSQLWRVLSVGDYDGDGKSDLLWRNSGNGSNTLWRSGNSATQIAVAGVTSQAWAIVPYENPAKKSGSDSYFDEIGI
jgi:sugar lactone lactonase YvrE